ncbi:MAG TPA: hypothetical protein VGM88_08290 [Kofleriaceae bacterium]|jgi:hypothetical protein
MSARSVRRTFATPLVITVASGCFVDRPPPPVYHNPPPQNPPSVVVEPQDRPPYPPSTYQAAPTTTQPPTYVQPGQPSPYVQPSPSTAQPGVVMNPPPPGVAPANAVDRRWTISRSINQCLASLQYACPAPTPGAPACVPPGPTLYTCPPDLPDSATMILYQRAGEPDCYVLPAPMSCPPNVMCNPPPPRKAICPQ